MIWADLMDSRLYTRIESARSTLSCGSIPPLRQSGDSCGGGGGGAIIDDTSDVELMAHLWDTLSPDSILDTPSQSVTSSPIMSGMESPPLFGRNLMQDEMINVPLDVPHTLLHNSTSESAAQQSEVQDLMVELDEWVNLDMFEHDPRHYREFGSTDAARLVESVPFPSIDLDLVLQMLRARCLRGKRLAPKGPNAYQLYTWIRKEQLGQLGIALPRNGYTPLWAAEPREVFWQCHRVTNELKQAISHTSRRSLTP